MIPLSLKTHQDVIYGKIKFSTNENLTPDILTVLHTRARWVFLHDHPSLFSHHAHFDMERRAEAFEQLKFRKASTTRRQFPGRSTKLKPVPRLSKSFLIRCLLTRAFFF